jgi:ribosomal protein S18 acetylase RimI-like enzyme
VTEINVAFQRALEFVRRIEDRCAAEATPFEWGALLCYPELPLVWALNFVRIDEVPDSVDAAALAGSVEAIPWPPAVTHRKIVVNDEVAGARFAPGFEALGWEVERLLFMALAGEPPIPPDGAPVREVSSAERASALVSFLPQVGTKYEPEVLHQIIASRAVVEEVIGVRRFGAFVDGTPASFCELFGEGGTAQIEDVATAAPFRGRGLSKAVVAAALQAARADGAEFVFLIADADDWPKEMYRNMGFADIGITYEFQRPSGHAE